LHVTFTPTVTEQLRATGELRRVARVYDAVAALPYFVACLIIGNAISQPAAHTGPLGVQEFVWLLLLGVGIRVRRGLGGSRGTAGGCAGATCGAWTRRTSSSWSPPSARRSTSPSARWTARARPNGCAARWNRAERSAIGR
jgi:hypothetical protein